MDKQITDTVCIPSVKAICEALRSLAPSSGVMAPASVTAAPSVSISLTSAILFLKINVPMLPKIAMPRAPPNSEEVSESEAAVPAFSGGALPTTISVARVNTGAMPSENMARAVTTNTRPLPGASCVKRLNPTAVIIKPEKTTSTGRNLLLNCGVAIEPMMKPVNEGSVHRPATRGDKLNTSCKN